MPNQTADNKTYDIIIMGAGCAGLTAAIYARRAGKTVLVLERDTFGGQIAFSPRVENYPAVQSASGEELANSIFEQAANLGADTELEDVLEVTKSANGYTIKTDYETYSCRALIVATGMKHRHMDLPNEEKLTGNGVSYCAVCDGVFYKDKEVAVYGGGDTALQDALFLSDICKSVTVIHRRNEFRGVSFLVDALHCRENVKLQLENVVDELVGDNHLEGVKLKSTKTGEITELAADALFVAIGQLPNSKVMQGIIKTDEAGFFVADEDCTTGEAGIFVAGDCRQKNVRQLTTAAADGAVASLAACRYIDSL